MLNLRSLFTGAAALLAAVFAASCQQNAYYRGPEVKPRAVVKDGVAITLKDQKLTLIRNGKKVKDYDVSTSKFGIGSRNGSNCTPVGIHAVTSKIGEGQPSGMVFKSCRPTGEVVPVNARGRDPIVTRIIQLAGVESRNRNSHSRRIYIHGTPEERKIGRPASYGCIRMRSADVIDLFRNVYRGMPIAIELCTQETYLKAEETAGTRRIKLPDSLIASLPTDSGRRSTRSFASSRSSKGRRSLASSRGSKARRTVASRRSSARRSVASSRRTSSSKKRRRS